MRNGYLKGMIAGVIAGIAKGIVTVMTLIFVMIMGFIPSAPEFSTMDFLYFRFQLLNGILFGEQYLVLLLQWFMIEFQKKGLLKVSSSVSYSILS
jgi:hypothetical protein